MGGWGRGGCPHILPAVSEHRRPGTWTAHTQCRDHPLQRATYRSRRRRIGPAGPATTPVSPAPRPYPQKIQSCYPTVRARPMIAAAVCRGRHGATGTSRLKLWACVARKQWEMGGSGALGSGVDLALTAIVVCLLVGRRLGTKPVRPCYFLQPEALGRGYEGLRQTRAPSHRSLTVVFGLTPAAKHR